MLSHLPPSSTTQVYPSLIVGVKVTTVTSVLKLFDSCLVALLSKVPLAWSCPSLSL